MQYGMLLPMGKVFYLSQLAADLKELVSDKICDITLHTNEKPGVEDAYRRLIPVPFGDSGRQFRIVKPLLIFLEAIPIMGISRFESTIITSILQTIYRVLSMTTLPVWQL